MKDYLSYLHNLLMIMSKIVNVVYIVLSISF